MGEVGVWPILFSDKDKGRCQRKNGAKTLACEKKSVILHLETYRIMDINPSEIGPKFIDLQRILEQKRVKAPRWVVRMLERLLHIEEINSGIYLNRELSGIDFARAFVEGKEPQNLGIELKLQGLDNIPREGNPMVVGNHPLGGPDGLALMDAVGRVRSDIKFPVNDFLLYLPGLRELFYPIDKVNRSKALATLEEAFASPNTLLYYPAGLCSRLQNGQVRDLEWKATFIKKAVRYQRDIVPAYTDARNRMRFYRLARLRQRLGIKFNFEMALLPAEMYAQRGKAFGITFGKPIPWQTFDKRHTAAEWAQRVKDHVYRLKDNPDATFEP